MNYLRCGLCCPLDGRNGLSRWAVALAVLASAVGCSDSLPVSIANMPGSDAGVDAAFTFYTGPVDAAVAPDLGVDDGLCVIGDPSCITVELGPPQSPFPLQSDANKNASEADQGLVRDANGWLDLSGNNPVLTVVWIANSDEGTMSKLDSKTVRELARYWTTTCYSLKTGSTAACDGTNGCCTVDDWDRYQARKNNQNQPGHQPVQIGRITPNYPSRTAVDLNGDLFVSNRAFGSQSSVTKIAYDQSECIDRNRNGKIDTSSDTNGNGFIETDCNGDGVMDDIASVKARPCTNGLKQEFYGDDDECVLWTSNTFINGDIGRSVALGAGTMLGAPSDVWAGAYQDGTMVRIDGTTGLDKADTKVGNNPHGLAIDSNGIAWSGPLGGPTLCYFDTNQPGNTACARTPNGFSVSGNGIAIDPDENVWIGAGVMRYSPDRSGGFNSLSNGFWMKISGATGAGIAADARSNKAYFVWSCAGATILEIPASTIPMPGRMGQPAADFQVPPNGWPSITMPCTGVGVDVNQNVWGISASTSTRALVDGNGKIAQPNVNGQTMGNNICPAGDSCPNEGADAYSDFTGFGLPDSSGTTGTYSMIFSGCVDANGQPSATDWNNVSWDAGIPLGTHIYAHARSGNAPKLDITFGQQTMDADASPLALFGNNLVPNIDSGFDGYLWVEFVLNSQNPGQAPKLKSFSVTYKCPPAP